MGVIFEAIVNITRAQTMANAKRTKYSRRSAEAVPAMPDGAAIVVVTVILSKADEEGGVERPAIAMSAGDAGRPGGPAPRRCARGCAAGPGVSRRWGA